MVEHSRRKMFGLAGAGAAATGLGIAGGVAADQWLGTSEQAVAESQVATVPFTGRHQAGITTPAQGRLHFVAFDVTTTDREELRGLLREWTEAAARMTAGRPAAPEGATGGSPEAPPEDTGEALGLPASSLTLTVGFGRSLFDDRFGLRDQLPPALDPLPRFPADELDPARSDGDLCVQACAEDPQVAVHAVRNLVRIAFGRAKVRWSQLGFGRTASTSREQETPRNLFGFKDGTNNIKAEESRDLAEHVWVQPGDGPDWIVDGTYLVARRIRMHIETWDRTNLAEQETIIGRSKGSGAPLGKVHEFDRVDPNVRGADGEPLIPEEAHIRLSSPEQNGGARILRRGYNFTDGSDGFGHLDAGLFFICFNRDPHTQFVPMQRALSSEDVMMEYIQHTGSAAFACPPGTRQGDYWGSSLFE